MIKTSRVSILIFAFLLFSLQPKQAFCQTQDLNLDSLGFSAKAVNPEEQKLLEQRRYDLEQHQLWGLVSVAGLLLTVGSAQDGQLNPEHALWAGVTAASYGAAAYYGLRAPTLKDSPSRGQTEWHKYLTWVHLPAMVLTVAAGVQAAKDRREGRPLSGLGKQHKNLQGVAASSLALSVLLVSFEF